MLAVVVNVSSAIDSHHASTREEAKQIIPEVAANLVLKNTAHALLRSLTKFGRCFALLQLRNEGEMGQQFAKVISLEKGNENFFCLRAES